LFYFEYFFICNCLAEMWTHLPGTGHHVIKRQTLHKQFQIDYLSLQIKIKSLSLTARKRQIL